MPTRSSKSVVLEKPIKEERAAPTVSTKQILVPIKQTISTSPPEPIWFARTGSTLHESVLQWANEAGWNVLWMAEDLDYPIIADLRYEGPFEQAVTKIFRAYEKAERPFWVNGNSMQKALVVMEKNTAQ